MKTTLHLLRVSFALACIFIFSSPAISQLAFTNDDFEAGITLAPSNFLGDLGGTKGKGGAFLKDNNLANTKLMASAHISKKINNWLSVRLAGSYGTIAADDAMIEGNGGMEEARKARNQNFKSRIAEIYTAAEFYPTVFLEEDPTDTYHKLRPYFIGGIGVFHFNPLGLDPATGNWIELKKLHTEGQGFPEYASRKNYNLNQVNIPMGFGIKYYTSERVSISLEGLLRKTFSDYLDDVSTSYIDPNLFFQHLDQSTAIVATRMFDKSVGSLNRNAGEKRGSANNKDSYYAVGFKVNIRLGGNNLGSLRCPIFSSRY
jgi:hypothetical protein